MRKFLTLTDSQRKNVYESISHKVNLPAQVVEKDFWVTAVLQTVFSLPIAEHLQRRNKSKQVLEAYRTLL